MYLRPKPPLVHDFIQAGEGCVGKRIDKKSEKPKRNDHLYAMTYNNNRNIQRQSINKSSIKNIQRPVIQNLSSNCKQYNNKGPGKIVNTKYQQTKNLNKTTRDRLLDKFGLAIQNKGDLNPEKLSATSQDSFYNKAFLRNNENSLRLLNFNHIDKNSILRPKSTNNNIPQQKKSNKSTDFKNERDNNSTSRYDSRNNIFLDYNDINSKEICLTQLKNSKEIYPRYHQNQQNYEQIYSNGKPNKENNYESNELIEVTSQQNYSLNNLDEISKSVVIMPNTERRSYRNIQNKSKDNGLINHNIGSSKERYCKSRYYGDNLAQKNNNLMITNDMSNSCDNGIDGEIIYQKFKCLFTFNILLDRLNFLY